MKKLILLFSIVLCFVISLCCACENGDTGSQGEEIDLPNEEIMNYLSELTDATIEAKMTIAQDETTIVAKVKDDRAEITCESDGEVIKNQYVLRDGVSSVYYCGERDVLCDQTDTEETVYHVNYFVDLIERGLNEMDLADKFSVARYGTVSGDHIAFSYQKEDCQIAGKIYEINKTVVDETPIEEDVYTTVTPQKADEKNRAKLFVSASVDDKTVAALNFVFDGNLAQMDILFFGPGLWMCQTNYVETMGERLYFCSEIEGWLYLDFAEAFTPSNVATVAAEHLFKLDQEVNADDLFGEGFASTMEGEESVIRCYYAESEESIARPEMMNESKENADRLVNY